MKELARYKLLNLPPDPEGFNAQCAERAKLVISRFRKLSGAFQETALRDLLHELMHLCDRDPTLGKFEEELEWAYLFYSECTQDNIDQSPAA